MDKCARKSECHEMLKGNLKMIAMDSSNTFDRLKLCWSHLDNWENLEIVAKCKKWLEETNTRFSPTTFIVYKDGLSLGMIEFVPLKLLKRVKLCPCRADVENNEVEERYILGKEFDNYLFVSCFLVNKDHQGKGVGKTLLNYFLNSEVFEKFEGALVYVTERDETWSGHIHWPAEPKEFYIRAGFSISKAMGNSKGYILVYKRRSKHANVLK